MTNLATVGANIAVDLIIGLVIKAKTGGDKTKEAARAAEVEAIAVGFQKLASGDATGGLAAIQGALVNVTALSPDEALALQNFINFVSLQGSAVSVLVNNTLAGQTVETIINNLTTEIMKVCNSFQPAATV